jgi:hypothetical protein
MTTMTTIEKAYKNMEAMENLCPDLPDKSCFGHMISRFVHVKAQRKALQEEETQLAGHIGMIAMRTLLDDMRANKRKHKSKDALVIDSYPGFTGMIVTVLLVFLQEYETQERKKIFEEYDLSPVNRLGKSK